MMGEITDILSDTEDRRRVSWWGSLRHFAFKGVAFLFSAF